MQGVMISVYAHDHARLDPAGNRSTKIALIELRFFANLGLRRHSVAEVIRGKLLIAVPTGTTIL